MFDFARAYWDKYKFGFKVGSSVLIFSESSDIMATPKAPVQHFSEICTKPGEGLQVWCPEGEDLGCPTRSLSSVPLPLPLQVFMWNL